MIKTLIFDFGDVFINLDKQGALQHALNLFKIDTLTEDMVTTNIDYEVGAISTEKFINFYALKFPNLKHSEICHAWNFIIKDFPEYRLEFLKTLTEEKKYKLILLSNTNAMHIEFIKQNVPFYDTFKNCFDAFYLSHEIQLRKPNTNIFDYVLEKNNLNAEECLFIDDTKENTDTALKMRFHIWNIDETQEDVVNLFEIKKDLF